MKRFSFSGCVVVSSFFSCWHVRSWCNAGRSCILNDNFFCRINKLKGQFTNVQRRYFISDELQNASTIRVCLADRPRACHHPGGCQKVCTNFRYSLGALRYNFRNLYHPHYEYRNLHFRIQSMWTVATSQIFATKPIPLWQRQRVGHLNMEITGNTYSHS